MQKTLAKSSSTGFMPQVFEYCASMGSRNMEYNSSEYQQIECLSPLSNQTNPGIRMKRVQEEKIEEVRRRFETFHP